VRDLYTELRRHERAGERRVHIAHDDEHIRGELQEHRLERRHRARRLLGVRAGADAQIRIRLGEPELLEEHVRHGAVVVLAGMYENLLKGAAVTIHRVHERRGLHEVGTCAYDVQNFHVFREVRWWTTIVC
jgi:hypothetical protein